MEAANQTQTDVLKWNKFVAALIEEAGLPSTCLVRLSYTNSKRETHEIDSYRTLNKLSTQYGIKSNAEHNGHLTITIHIEVLALNFEQYGKRLMYERRRFIENNVDNLLDAPSAEFKLSALTSTTAVLRHKLHNEDPPIAKQPDAKPPSLAALKCRPTELNVLDAKQPAKPSMNPTDDEKDEPVAINADENSKESEKKDKELTTARDDWVAGSEVEIYSSSQKEWFKGSITDIFTDDEGEWLKVQYIAYGIRKNKQVQRYNSYVRPIGGQREVNKNGVQKNGVLLGKHSDYNEMMKHLIKHKNRMEIYKHVNRTLDELEQAGVNDMDKTLSVIQDVLNVKAIMSHKFMTANELDKKEEAVDGWECSKCTLVNYKDFTHCQACYTPQP